MINRRIRRNIILVLLLAIFIALVTILRLRAACATVPQPLPGLAIVLLLAQLYWEKFRPGRRPQDGLDEGLGADKNIAEVEVKFSSVMVAALPRTHGQPRVPTLRQEASPMEWWSRLSAC